MKRRLQKITVTKKVQLMMIGLGLVMTGFVTPALAVDSEEQEESYYSNPAQAAHAAQLAEEDAKSNEEVTQAWQDYQDALDALGDDPSEEELEAVELLEEDYEDALAEALGTTADEIEAMRESGMGWGEIAQALDIHPGLLGLGHTKRKRNRYADEDIADDSSDEAELTEATARNTKGGYAKGHSYAASNNGKSKSKSSGVDTADSSVSSAAKSSNGKSADAPGQQAKSTSSTKTKSNNGNSSNSSNKSNNGNSSNNGNKGGNSGK